MTTIKRCISKNVSDILNNFSRSCARRTPPEASARGLGGRWVGLGERPRRRGSRGPRALSCRAARRALPALQSWFAVQSAHNHHINVGISQNGTESEKRSHANLRIGNCSPLLDRALTTNTDCSLSSTQSHACSPPCYLSF